MWKSLVVSAYTFKFHIIMKPTKKYVTQILEILHQEYENPKTELENWKTPEEFMVAVILSAQATDKGVNKVTKALFEKYKSPKDFANAKPEDVAKLIKSINYYKTKAKRIIDANKFVVENYGGKLPADIDKLVKIPGIGRKSANVILHETLETSQGIVVDTHVKRVSYRLGLTKETDSEKVEQDLMKIIPKEEWGFFSTAIVLHGRYVCKAKNPDCENCALKKICKKVEI